MKWFLALVSRNKHCSCFGVSAIDLVYLISIHPLNNDSDSHFFLPLVDSQILHLPSDASPPGAGPPWYVQDLQSVTGWNAREGVLVRTW